MPKNASLQDPFLNALRREKVPVAIYLVNGIKLQGEIESFDQYVVILHNTLSQMVYKHAISTIVPARAVSSSLLGKFFFRHEQQWKLDLSAIVLVEREVTCGLLSSTAVTTDDQVITLWGLPDKAITTIDSAKQELAELVPPTS